MKAAQINEYGNKNVIKFKSDVKRPNLEEGQVSIDIKAACLNSSDGLLRSGILSNSISLSFPITLGGDFSGVVLKVDPSVKDFNVGDKVYGQAGRIHGGSGSLAEYAAGLQHKIYLKPESIKHIVAASLPLVGVSATQALEDVINIKKGKKF